MNSLLQPTWKTMSWIYKRLGVKKMLQVKKYLEHMLFPPQCKISAGERSGHTGYQSKVRATPVENPLTWALGDPGSLYPSSNLQLLLPTPK
jgi:hypothetical protein